MNPWAGERPCPSCGSVSGTLPYTTRDGRWRCLICRADFGAQLSEEEHQTALEEERKQIELDKLIKQQKYEIEHEKFGYGTTNNAQVRGGQPTKSLDFNAYYDDFGSYGSSEEEDQDEWFSIGRSGRRYIAPEY